MSDQRGTPRRRAGLVTATPPERNRRRRFWDQVNRNLVALISLALAITSLGYNTWRNETTEVQRNWRQAAFQILGETGEINRIILMRRYFSETTDGERQPGGVPLARNWVAGWGSVTMVRDVASVMPDPLPERGRALFRAWEEHAGALDDIEDPEARQQASEQLLHAVDRLRNATVELIARLR